MNQEGSRYCSSCGKSISDFSDETTTNLTPIELSTESGDDNFAKTISELPKDRAYLVIRTGEETGSWFLLDGEITRIGRHPESDIFLDDITVSRRHCEIRRDGMRFIIKDAGSLNGSYLNRERVDQAELKPGDMIQIGKYRFSFVLFISDNK